MSENKNNLVCISGVRGYEEDGVAYLHIEDSARGLGFTQMKGETEYVRWETVDKYLADFRFPNKVGNENPHDYYIPENIFYRLCMKAKNDVAEAVRPVTKGYRRLSDKKRRIGLHIQSPQVVIPEIGLE